MKGKLILNGTPKVKKLELNYEALETPTEGGWTSYRPDSLSISTTVTITLESIGDMGFLFGKNGLIKKKLKQYLMSKLQEI